MYALHVHCGYRYLVLNGRGCNCSRCHGHDRAQLPRHMTRTYVCVTVTRTHWIILNHSVYITNSLPNVT